MSTSSKSAADESGPYSPTAGEEGGEPSTTTRAGVGDINHPSPTSTSPPSPSVREITTYCDRILAIDSYQDASENGLQVEAQAYATRIGIAVDAGESVIATAISRKVDFLIVHHGIFWGQPRRLTGSTARKVAALLRAPCSLYAAHLPLDGHRRFGNAACIAELLGAHIVDNINDSLGQPVGVVVELKSEDRREATRDGVITTLREHFPGGPFHVLPFGPSAVRKIGIVTGAGGSLLQAAVAKGVDLLVSGEVRHDVYHLARELSCTAVFVGHYRTETFGVLSFGRHLADTFYLPWDFIDEDSGI